MKDQRNYWIDSQPVPVLALLSYPPTEMDALDGVPLHSSHVALMAGVPMLLTLVAILFAKRDIKLG